MRSRQLFLILPLVLFCAVGPLQAREASLALRDLDGVERSTGELRGNIVVLNFWATWCVPCRVEMPMLARLHREVGPRGVEFVGASADEESSRSQIGPLLEEATVGFPIWLGATTADMERFGLGRALPATAILDRDGSIAFRLLGPLDEHDLRDRLVWLLGERSDPPPEVLVDTFEEHHAEASDHGDHDDHHHHEDEEDHQHGSIALEGASLVPS